ncbi:nuclear transport factor 2 family protein [Amylibacter sp. IMCC11727]|uniref:nuclear transport factor 2 family protein n=1 Tax=Amylibacter sp. IMCC11727 TaxID=3039851 RepID=UPI00244E2439|nr:nuclear transport factor 2 family protein [Amylibacter sp. IMCC11727]WGI20895.1 nuclear transport factor 2 family protein [Amylibacter sp. IMCC11727]
MPVPSQKITNLTQSFCTAWTDRDAFAVAGLFEADATFLVNGTPAKDPKAIADVADGFFTLFPDLHFMADDTRIASPNALLSWTFYGHHQKTKSFTKLSGWITLVASDTGKIATAQMFYDPSALKG